jgi:DNA repair exonuclease SbcCD ATPase subunit
MSFFENLKKNFNTAANYTVQKTGEVTEAAKIRLDIRSQNVRLAKCFENMGQLYYKSVKESGTDVTAELDAYMMEADGIKAEIANLRRELAKAQGCVICAACGAQISNKSVFCPLCGVKLAAEEEETVADTETVEAETEQTTEE